MSRPGVAAVAATLSILATAPSAADAQFAPPGATIDRSNASSATRTSSQAIYKLVDHYYYDCLKKKWVWVSREWSAKSAHAFGSDEYSPIAPPAGTRASPDVKELPSGSPPGTETSPADPEHAFNPRTGENFVWVGDGWVETKTGKKMPAPRLCPPCPEKPSSTTPPNPPRKTPEPKHAENAICPEERKSVGLLAPQPPNAFDRRILDLHNTERAAVGTPPLEWNQELADHAEAYAKQLARGGQLVHAPREGRGIERENLQQGLIGWGPDRLMQTWIREKSDFVAGDFPNVARDGDWMKVAHYTQMIWPSTVAVGCGVAQGAGYSWFVCRYSPGGNKDGKPVGLPVQIAKRPCTDDAVVPNERG